MGESFGFSEPEVAAMSQHYKEATASRYYQRYLL